MKKIITILENNKQVDEYKITNVTTTSTELFFIKEELQMNRAKDVTHVTINVYKNFEENGIKYKGSSQTLISPTNTNEEIERKINQAVLAASFVKNEYYSLVEPSNEIAPEINSAFKSGNVINSIGKLVKDLYEENNQFEAFINSTEFFINKKEIQIINSKGLNISYDSYQCEIELITEANGANESIEIYEVFNFSDYDQEYIKTSIVESLENASLRAQAVPMPKVENLPVILRGSSSKELWDYYSFCTSGAQIYEHLHNHKVGENIQGENIQGENIQGDKVSISRKPNIPNSTASRYYDGDGVYLREIQLLKNGIITSLLAGKRISDYLKIPCTGNVGNMVVEGGSYSEDELRKGPHLEIISFSDFQSDPMTGFFGGEFRLGIYFDGEKKTPVTLGSISGNIKKVQSQLYLSKELTKSNNFIGPKLIKINNISIAGN